MINQLNVQLNTQLNTQPQAQKVNTKPKRVINLNTNTLSSIIATILAEPISS